MHADNGEVHDLNALRRLVVGRQVCWDVFREKIGFADRGVKAVGYELVLTGVHLPGEHPPRPGCDLCKEVYDDLKKIALWILPEEHRPSVYEIEPYHAVIRSTGKRKLRSEVSLSIRILHRHHFDAPIDACETRCLVDMEKRLKTIWACEGPWVPLQRRGLRLPAS